MNSNVTEVAANVYRISTFHPDYQIQFNQYLIKDDEPFLMHTGFRKMFDVTREEVASLMDPSLVRWFGFSHFESDECGALNDWLRIAPAGQAVCSLVGAMVMVLIAVHGRPAWVTALVYVTVLITVLSGADYFFGLRRRLQATASSQARRLV